MPGDSRDLSFPIGKEDEAAYFDSNYNEKIKIELLHDIKMLPANLEYAIQNLDEYQLETPYRPDGWTVKQLIHHVADSHLNAYIRFKLGLTEHNPTIRPYDQDAWAQMTDTKNLPVNISLTLLHSLHARWYQFMFDMSEDQWQRTIYHPGREKTLTLWDLLKSYSWHSRHHTAHITSLRERMKWH
ncbi:MAG: YfiT family bacillithiol transferase [Ginsengibacter sp.]